MKVIGMNQSGAGLSIGLVRARWNESVGLAEEEACLARLAELGVANDRITLVTVPGALEAPLALQALAKSGRFHALVAFGAVIRGETYHFELVSNESGAGITRVQLDTGIPVANGILTTDTDEQAAVRAAQKGRDCAEAAVEMARLVAAVEHRA